MDKLDDLNKWMFCSNKKCPYCKGDLSKQEYSDYEFVTKCVLCDRSFLE